MSNTLDELKAPREEQLTRKEGSLKPKTIDKLPPNQRAWADNVMRVLGIKSRGSQARVLAGAIASATLVEKNGSEEDKRKAKELRAIVIAAGTPPWKDAKKAMAANDAKLQLDMLSIPEDERGMKPLDPGKKGIHQAFWIDRKDADGQDRHSYLCKPATEPNPEDDTPAPSGGKPGGEVMREALAGRAAQLLAAQTGIDIGMPESHVVKLDGGMMPGGEQGKMLTCSVQEARSVKGDLRGASDIAIGKLPADQVQGIAIFDTLTLNTDRHAGNLMLGTDGTLVPIDHGESFAENNAEGIKRVGATMGGPHNAMLQIPSAHAPMSKEMLKQLKALDPEKYARGLAKENGEIGGVHDDMKDAISPGAIESARRAATFVKMAAKNEPPLSPASIQVALGGAAERLLDPVLNDRQFRAAAAEVIARMAPRQEVVKEVCTAGNLEYAALVKKVEARGWICALRRGEPVPGAITDPLVMMKIIEGKIDCPRKPADKKELMKTIISGPPNTENALKVVIDNRIEVLQGLMGLIGPNEMRNMRGDLLKIVGRSKEDQLHDLSLAIGRATQLAVEFQTARAVKLNSDHRISDLYAVNIMANRASGNGYDGALSVLSVRDPFEAARLLKQAEDAAGRGEFLPAAVRERAKALRKLADTLMVPSDDVDLVAGLQAAGQGDPFRAEEMRKQLLERNKNGEFVEKPLKQLLSEIEALEEDFVIDPESTRAKVTQQAIKDKNIPVLADAVGRLTVEAKSGNLPPSEEGLKRVAKGIGVPEMDEDYVAALDAVKQPDAKEAMARLKKLLERQKTGEFGTAGEDEVRRQLRSITDLYVVPDVQSDLVEIEEFLKDGKTVDCLPLVTRLRLLAGAGVFAKV